MLVIYTSMCAVTPTNAVSPSYFVPKQVIVTGRELAVRDVIAASGIALTRLERISLSYTTGLPSLAPFPFPPPRTDLVMDLYRIDSNSTVPATVNAIHATAAALGKLVFADPNYATGRSPAPVSADPWSVEGSPAGGSSAVGADLFDRQWAFGKGGIGLYSTLNPPVRAVPETGTRVRVGIFDTSPLGLKLATTKSVKIGWAKPVFTLVAAHPNFAATWPAPAILVDVSDHGLFAAGLVHAVAPASEIQLVRVLDKYGQGDLYTLAREIHRFISGSLPFGPTLDGAVINLSLGVHPPPNAAALGLPAEITALRAAMLAADGLKIPVVAAAGNDGNADAMQLPASYATVVGVAASNAPRGRACFSNRGDVAAPGGEGRGKSCAPAIAQCTADCAAGIVGLAMIGDPKVDTGYIYWTGTSFAAPLTSGAAALVVDQRNGSTSAGQVTEQIYGGAVAPLLPPADTTLGAGIISLRRILQP